MKIILSIFLLFISAFYFDSALANEEQMKETLVRIIDQLESLKPLIAEAAREQPSNPRVKVNFDRFKGADGKWHNGLRQDINNIQNALIQVVNKEGVEPRNVSPINDDFISGDERI